MTWPGHNESENISHPNPNSCNVAPATLPSVPRPPCHDVTEMEYAALQFADRPTGPAVCPSAAAKTAKGFFRHGKPTISLKQQAKHPRQKPTENPGKPTVEPKTGRSEPAPYNQGIPVFPKDPCDR